MKRLALTLATAALAVLLLAPAAQAEFGLNGFDVEFLNEDGTPATQAGSHPFALRGQGFLNTAPGKPNQLEGELKDLWAEQIVGLAGSPDAVPRCSTLNFLERMGKGGANEKESNCPDSTAVGTIAVPLETATDFHGAAVFNLEPPPGVAAKLGFMIAGIPVTLEVGLKSTPPYEIVARAPNAPQVLKVFGSVLELWGNPASSAHDPYRGFCAGGNATTEGEIPSRGICSVGIPEKPFLTMPRACTGPLKTTYAVDSWGEPGSFLSDGEPNLLDPHWKTGFAETHDQSTPPIPLGMTGCGKLIAGFSPKIESIPTTESAETGAGLDFNLDIEDPGLTNPKGTARTDVKDAVVTLPRGVTINPSVGEGLGVCTPDQLAKETAFSHPGEACPNASKIGTVHVESPLIEEAIDGDVFLAQQDDPKTTTPGAENPFDSLIALYFVIRNPTLGVIVKLPAKVEPDPNTGQLVTTVEDSPQIPFSHFGVHLRTGARAALVTPNACGTYETKALFTPWAEPNQQIASTASFKVTRGIGGGPCPPGGIPPFHPRFEAGSINNNAGSFSPFNMRLQRADGEQDMTKFSSILPPGELGSLKGIDKCPDSAVAIAKAKSGREELASPSCPSNSLIGHTLAGAGVGDALTYVGGQIYLAGPYKGDPLSVIAITPAVAGPFDAGTVVVRLALTLNPKTAEVEVDGAASDPIPHILKGIVLKVRDLRVYVDRPNFTLNPTSCEPSFARGVLFGSYLNVLDPSDDQPFDLKSRYQAASCASLGFKPKLDFKLKGGTSRGGHPALEATYTPRKGDANVKGLVVRLPRSAFLDQSHIGTICTRVQFAAKACPPGARYGFIKAWTPLLDDPLEGPVYLRSSNHNLPDLVFDLHGLVDVEVQTRIDSQKGGIRATVEGAPDAPISKVLLKMQGQKKGLIVNSRDLCSAPSKANVAFEGHNGKRAQAKPAMRAKCGGGRHAKRGRAGR
jgi:hypothetical protein